MGTDQIIYIRTDGNKELATGHIMRCLTIAEACGKKGARVSFIVSDAESEALLLSRMEAEKGMTGPASDGVTECGGAAEQPFPIIKLQTDYRDTEEELPILCQILMSYPCQTLLVDSYFVTPGYLDTLSRVTRVAYLDDLYAFPYPVHTVINYDIDPDPATDCYQFVTNKLLGPAYTPLRDMFAHCSYTVRPAIKNILLTAGGMNDGRYFIELIHAVLRYFGDPAEPSGSPAIHILTGSADLCPELSALLEKRPDIIRHAYVSDMADFLCGFDLVLTASGTTLYEICALGIPCISFVTADNQIPSAAAFARAGLVPCIGDLRDTETQDTDTLGEEASREASSSCTDTLMTLLETCADYETRCACSAKMTAAIDKNGAGRIADALLSLCYL